MQANNIQHVLSSYCEPGTILRGTCGFAVNKTKTPTIMEQITTGSRGNISNSYLMI